MKGELLEEAEKLVEELLEWEETHPESEFEEMEKLVLALLRRFGKRLADTLLEIQSNACQCRSHGVQSVRGY